MSLGCEWVKHLPIGLTFNARLRYVHAMTDASDDEPIAQAPGTALVLSTHPPTARKRERSAAAIKRREQVKSVLAAIGEGKPPAVAIRKSGMTTRAFYKLLRSSPSLDRAYELSRQAGAQILADQGLALAAHLSRKPDATPSQVMSLKLRLDYLRWYVGKLHPDTFDDRLAKMGDGGGKSVTVVVVMDDRKPPAD